MSFCVRSKEDRFSLSNLLSVLRLWTVILTGCALSGLGADMHQSPSQGSAGTSLSRRRRPDRLRTAVPPLNSIQEKARYFIRAGWLANLVACPNQGHLSVPLGTVRFFNFSRTLVTTRW